MRLVRILLRYFPFGLSAICFFQNELSRYFLMQGWAQIEQVIDTGADALLVPFPNAFFVTAYGFVPDNSAWYLCMGLVFVLVIGPIAWLTGTLLERFSSSWPRAMAAIIFYIAVSGLSFGVAIRAAFGLGLF